MLGLSRTWCTSAGNTTAIGSLLFGTAYLGPGDPSAVAQNLSEVLRASNLPGETQKEALAQAIQQALVPPSNIQEAFAQVVLPQAMQQLVPNAAAALVAAAVTANQVAAVAEGFTMVNLSLLTVLGAVALHKCRHLQLLSSIWMARHAISDSHPACIPLQALYAPLQVFCCIEATAQNISRTARQAVSSAIPAVFGAAPCKPYTGQCTNLCQIYMYTVCA